jgi:predicted esterase
MANRHALIVPALKKHTATVIMAHGLGDSGAGWVSLAENWRRRGKFEDVKFVFPNAPSIPITIVSDLYSQIDLYSSRIQNAGYVMPGWYDIVSRRDNVRNPLLLLPSGHPSMLTMI